MEIGANNSNIENQDINFKIDNMNIEKINNLSNEISLDKYIKNIFRHFESFQYKLLDEKKYHDYIESQFKNILKNDYNLTDEKIKIIDTKNKFFYDYIFKMLWKIMS